MATAIRPYIVTEKNGGAKRLIKASSQAQARNFVARDQYGVEAASASDVIDLMESGIKAETATPETDKEGE
jgi:peptide subunit release factor RF-3